MTVGGTLRATGAVAIRGPLIPNRTITIRRTVIGRTLGADGTLSAVGAIPIGGPLGARRTVTISRPLGAVRPITVRRTLTTGLIGRLLAGCPVWATIGRCGAAPAAGRFGATAERRTLTRCGSTGCALGTIARGPALLGCCRTLCGAEPAVTRGFTTGLASGGSGVGCALRRGLVELGHDSFQDCLLRAWRISAKRCTRSTKNLNRHHEIPGSSRL